jgi:hypothetical protein
MLNFKYPAMKKLLYLFAIVVIISGKVNAQFTITSDTNTVQLVNNFILSGVTASNILYTGAANTLGSFANGNTTNIGLTNGIIMTTGLLDTVPQIGSPVSNFANSDNSAPGCAELDNLILGSITYNASKLEFDLVPAGNVLEFQYVFASEEYPEYVGSSFNDVFGFFINGANPSGGNYVDSNIAIIPGTSLPVAINNVNATLNSTYFIDNQTLNGQTIVFDGFTTVLLAQIFVNPGTTYHLKMAIADVGDGIFDSGIFLKAQSMKSYNMTTGIGEQQINSFSFYPNPVIDKLNISLKGNSEIQILNAEGQVMKSMNVNDNHITIDISDFVKGVYIVKVKNEKGIAIKKFIRE